MNKFHSIYQLLSAIALLISNMVSRNSMNGKTHKAPQVLPGFFKLEQILKPISILTNSNKYLLHAIGNNDICYVHMLKRQCSR